MGSPSPNFLYECMFLPIKRFFKYFQRFTIVYLLFIISYFTSGLILNAIQASLFWTLRPFNKNWYRKINYYFLYSWYSQMVYMLQWWSDSKLLVYTEKNDSKNYFGKEHALVLMNHSYEIDWLTKWQFLEGIGVLGNFKAFVKKSILYLPPIGLICKFAEFILLDRSFEKDKENINRQINDLGDYTDPILLLLYAEGTRLSPEKLKASQDFAKERGLPVLKHHLLPRTKGFITSLNGMQDKIKVVYNIQMAFSKDAETAPTITNLLRGKSLTTHLYVDRIPIESIPKDEEGASKWLYQLYEKKDRLQDTFYKTNSFYSQISNTPIKPYNVPRSIWPIVNTVFWNIVILVPILRYLVFSLLQGEIFHFSIASGILCIFYFLMKHVIGNTEIKKSSSYGITKKD